MSATKPDFSDVNQSGHEPTHDSRTDARDSMTDFAGLLRALRQERGWSLTELAQQMGYHRSYVSKVESGSERPGGRVFAERADAALGADGRLIARWECQRPGTATASQRDEAPSLRLLDSHADVQAALWQVVDEAARILVCAGSRSRDEEYLRFIEHRLAAGPDLAYCRILFGPPWHAALRDHLLRVLEIRDPDETAKGAGKLIFIGIFDDDSCEPERFLCANERSAVLPQLPLHGLSWYDTALVVNDPSMAGRWVARMQEAYRHGRPVESSEDVLALPLLKEDHRHHAFPA